MYVRYNVTDLPMWSNRRMAPRMLKKDVQQGRSERRGEEVRTALRVTVRPSMSLGERISPFSISNIRGVPLNVEPRSDARTKLADFFSILLIAYPDE
jgi:hypothetical protein